MMKHTNKYRTTLTALLGTMLLASALVALGQSEPSGIMALAAAGNRYAAAYVGRTIRIWDATTEQVLVTIADTTVIEFGDELVYRIADLDFSSDGAYLAASFSGGIMMPGLVRVFDVTTGNIVSESSVWSGAGDIAWSPDASQLAARVASGAGSRFLYHLMVWNIQNSDVVIEQELGTDAGILNISWNPDGRHLATVDRTSLYVSDTSTWSRLLSGLFPAEITDITWSPDGDQIAGVDALSTAYVVNMSTNQLVLTLPGTSSNEYIQKLVWNSDDLIAVTNTHEILVWDAISGNLLQTIEAPYVIDLAWLPDNRLLYAGSETPTEPAIVDLSAIVPTHAPTAVPQLGAGHKNGPKCRPK